VTVADLIALGEPLVEFAADDAALEGFTRGWGGDTSNFAIAAARLGASSAYLTRVGNDEFGQRLLALWREEGVDTIGVAVDDEAPTGIYFIVPAEDGSSRFVYYRANSAASRMRPADIHRDLLRGGRVLHITGISQAISGDALATSATAIEIAAEAGLAVSYDANVRTALQPPSLLRACFEMSLPRADLLFVSTEDLEALYGDRPADDALDEFAEAGPEIVVLKLGAEGAVLSLPDGTRTELPAFEVESVDPTGAGDAFAAAFVVAYLSGEPPEEAGTFASAVGALTATGVGAVAPLPRRGEVEEFLSARGAGLASVPGAP
jgi:2-dehydro-3-deoxygluconokinase